jgi:hypothetical protein
MKTILILSSPGPDDDDELLACSENVETLKRFAFLQCGQVLQWSGDDRWLDDGGELETHTDDWLWDYRIRSVKVL